MVEFGDPSTWGMTVDQFIDEKEYTLPITKPQETLDSKKTFGQYARQIATGAKPIAKLIAAESGIGSLLAPLDFGEGRTAKEVLLNAVTLGAGLPVKDARERSDYVDRFGLKDDLLSAQMKQAGLGKIREGMEMPELTDREKLALSAAEQFEQTVLAPRLEKQKLKYKAASKPDFGLDEEIN